jgi:DMSO/TMAO reductase YedYZ molybdopterin-dependent catalytic subunit
MGTATLLALLSGADSMSGADVFPTARFVRRIEFEDEGAAPVDTLMGTELDARLYTDLSRLSAGRTITPTREFYIRTAASRLLPVERGWQVAIDRMVGKSSHLGISALRTAVKPMGTHLMECAGNVRLTRFGLISVASWTGVPLMELLDRAGIKGGGTWVRVSGFDEYATESRTSVPGASWIFSLDELKAADAFLATQMNGVPLTADHGAPIRLVAPGWYGCACIKWVNRITVVDDSADATTQMQEYAVRTLQEGIPQMARDFEPATIDHAAMPIGVEQWLVGGKPRYRVVGIAWGGREPIKRLQIRFNPDEEFVDVTGFHQEKTDPWTLWPHLWAPRNPGTYSIQLAVAEPAVRARKLDSGYYVRTVTIGEV